MSELKTIPLDKIRIPDVRVNSILNDEQRAFMASTIREIGVIQDIVVRELVDGTYELVAGKSRLEELRNQGARESQTKVIAADEKLGLVMNIVENVSRGEFEYVSVAQTIRKLRALGTTDEELERVFPWSKRWIRFIEELQDLPDDIVEAVKCKKITPTHVQIALNLPTAFEVHDGLKTAVNLGWDTGTFKTFVQNRVEQIARARAEAESRGVELEIPPANPEQLISYKQCLLCGFKKPSEQVTMQLVCDTCNDIAGYVTANLGSTAEAVQTLYAALQVYHGQPVSRGACPPAPKEAGAPE